MLSDIRAALAGSARTPATYADLPRPYQAQGNLSPAKCVTLMIERLREYDAEVVECDQESLPRTIALQIEKSGRRVLVAPKGLRPEWMPSVCEWRIDSGLSHEEIEQTEGVLTAASFAIAESGTIVLHHTPAEGRRILTLLPDWHLCVLRASQIVETLPEYFERCGPAPALVTFISGPSATADIEMTRIKGVHGPRFLHVILAYDR